LLNNSSLKNIKSAEEL
jgi:hypothetical protein